MTSTIERRFRFLEYAKQLVMWTVTAVVCTLAFRLGRGHVAQLTFFSFVALAIAFGLVTVVVQKALRCPRCHADLRHAGGDAVLGKKIERCPSCGLGFTEPFSR